MCLLDGAVIFLLVLSDEVAFYNMSSPYILLWIPHLSSERLIVALDCSRASIQCYHTWRGVGGQKLNLEITVYAPNDLSHQSCLSKIIN